MASPKNWNRICISAGIAAILGLSSCTKVYIEEPIDKQIVVVSSTIGPGDNGYYDLIIKGLTGVYMDHSVACMNYLIPETLEQAESLIYKWIEKSGREAAQTLLVLPASEFRDITERLVLDSNIKPKNKVEILTFEIPELPQSQNNIPTYSFMIPMYGASYQAGICAAEMGCANPLIWLAYDSDAVLINAANGFEAGYKSVTGRVPDRRYLSDNWNGYAMDREAYIQMEEIDGKYDFIFPVMGGSNMGIFRYLRENPDGPWVAGMDIDQSPFSSKVVGSVIKRIDKLVVQIIRDWINGVPIEHYTEYDTQSGYIEWCPVAH